MSFTSAPRTVTWRRSWSTCRFLPRHWWQHVLHNQTALLVKGALLFRENTVVADVPYLLKR